MTKQTVKKAVVEGAGGVVFNSQGLVLVLGHKNGDWVFPKGHIEAGESKLEAALREVQEEAGVDAHCPFPHLSTETRYQNARNEERVITWFKLYSEASEPILREKTFPKGAFLKPKKALKTLSFEEDINLLKTMLEIDA